MRLSHGHQTAIDTQIILRHAPRGEAFLKATSDFLAGQMSEPVNCADRAADVLYNEAGYAVVDHFRRRTAIECDYRRAAGHRFDHDQAERVAHRAVYWSMSQLKHLLHLWAA